MLLPLLPVLARTQAETPQIMLQAAEARLRDAEALLERQQWDGTIYLAGYVAEMLMKVAFCRLDPSFPVHGTVDSTFGPAEALWKSLLPSGTKLPSQWRHNLLFWETVLQGRRSLSAVRPMDWGNALLMSRHLNTIRRHWKVELRYQAPIATADEASEVFDAAQWLFDNRLALWG